MISWVGNETTICRPWAVCHEPGDPVSSRAEVVAHPVFGGPDMVCPCGPEITDRPPGLALQPLLA